MTKTSRPVFQIFALAAVFAVMLGIYGYGASNSPLTSEALAERKAYVRQHVELRRAELRARAYWARNPDVRESVFFGENGVQGIFGAWVHYERHGRDEGRKWGL